MFGLEKIDKLEKMVLALDNAVENLQSEVTQKPNFLNNIFYLISYD